MTRRLPRQMAALLTVSALLTLAGCVTVHGEREIVPAVTKAEAGTALAHFTDAYNTAHRKLQPTPLETGALGVMESAGLKAQRANHPGGDPGFQPLRLAAARFLIPRQAGWPKWFVADTHSNRNSDRWLLVFTRTGAGAPWKAAYLSILNPTEVPDFATDRDGYVKPVPTGPGSGLMAHPATISKLYADYLQSGQGKAKTFADGPATSGIRQARDRQRKTPQYWTEFIDQPAQPPAFAPMALRTKDGGALVFFAAHHLQKQTMAQGLKIKKIRDPNVNALLEGDAKKSLTLVRISESAVTVPARKADGGQIVFLNRLEGLTAARGD